MGVILPGYYCFWRNGCRITGWSKGEFYPGIIPGFSFYPDDILVIFSFTRIEILPHFQCIFLWGSLLLVRCKKPFRR
jgi:hypothetical protein